MAGASVKMPLGVTAPEPVSDVASNVVDFSVDEGVKSPVPKREICRVVDLCSHGRASKDPAWSR